METESKYYELAYLLSPGIPEDEVLGHTQKLTSAIEDAKGIIKHVESPVKRKLAYLVEKERNAYFGWISFHADPGQILTLEKRVKSTDMLLRHLIVQTEERKIQSRTLRTVPGRHASTPHAQPVVIPREQEKADEKLDLEALDKKLEEILGK